MLQSRDCTARQMEKNRPGNEANVKYNQFFYHDVGIVLQEVRYLTRLYYTAVFLRDGYDCLVA